jgi:hypothetical protein
MAKYDDPARAYTLLVSAYDEVRRALSFVRRAQDDVDEIAPSLYAKGRREADKAGGAAVTGGVFGDAG